MWWQALHFSNVVGKTVVSGARENGRRQCVMDGREWFMCSKRQIFMVCSWIQKLDELQVVKDCYYVFNSLHFQFEVLQFTCEYMARQYLPIEV